jgi:condensin complex subunit 3
LTSYSEDIFTLLRDAILRRVQDKEAIVRSQAVLALSKLCITEIDDDSGSDDVPVIDMLLDSLAHDPSACVLRPPVVTIIFNHINAVMSVVLFSSTYQSIKTRYLIY